MWECTSLPSDSVLNPNGHAWILFLYCFWSITSPFPVRFGSNFILLPKGNVRAQQTDVQCTHSPLPSLLLLSPPFPSSYFPSLFPLPDFSRAECCCIRSNSWSPGEVHSKASQLVRIFFFPLPFPSLLLSNWFLLKLCIFWFQWLDFICLGMSVKGKKYKITRKLGGVSFFLGFTLMLQARLLFISLKGVK